MSAVAISAKPDVVHVAADTAAYDTDTGEFLFETQKARVIDRLACVIANTGAGGFTDWVVKSIEGAPAVKTFDDLLTALPALVVGIQAGMERLGTTQPDLNSSIMAIGYSERDQQVVAVRVLSVGKESIGNDGAPVNYPAGHMEQITGIYATAAPAPEAQNAFGFEIGNMEGMPGREAVLRLVCALRSESRVRDANDPVSYGVGGALMHFEVTREGVTETEAHRWPDVIGEAIDPNRGERLPAGLT